MFLTVSKLKITCPLEVPMMWNSIVEPRTKKPLSGKDISIFSRDFDLFNFSRSQDSDRAVMLEEHYLDVKERYGDGVFSFSSIKLENNNNNLISLTVTFRPNGEIEARYKYINYERCVAHDILYYITNYDKATNLELLRKVREHNFIPPEVLSSATIYTTNDKFRELIKHNAKRRYDKLVPLPTNKE